MQLFEIKDKDSSIKMESTHYYNWLVSNKKQDVHNIKTKIEYLEVQGFIVGYNFLREKDLLSLKYIEQHFTTNLFKTIKK